jgi:menaquinone-dependent protoporphyrinogen oxidase
MRVLIAYASKHGSTRDIAGRLADRLEHAGLKTETINVAGEGTPPSFDAAVVGSAVYMGRWMKEAAAFVRAHGAALSERPLWLFSSGPVGSKPLPDALEAAEFRTSFEARDHRTFAGALDKRRLSMAERLMVKAVKAPHGDFRDWEEIDAWADDIAIALGAAPATTGGVARRTEWTAMQAEGGSVLEEAVR